MPAAGLAVLERLSGRPGDTAVGQEWLRESAFRCAICASHPTNRCNPPGLSRCILIRRKLWSSQGASQEPLRGRPDAEVVPPPARSLQQHRPRLILRQWVHCLRIDVLYPCPSIAPCLSRDRKAKATRKLAGLGRLHLARLLGSEKLAGPLLGLLSKHYSRLAVQVHCSVVLGFLGSTCSPTMSATMDKTSASRVSYILPGDDEVSVDVASHREIHDLFHYT